MARDVAVPHGISYVANSRIKCVASFVNTCVDVNTYVANYVAKRASRNS